MNSQDPYYYGYPPPRQRRSPFSAIALLVSLTALVLVAVRYGDRALSDDHYAATPRPVAARGDLSESEKATINLFEHCSPSVVYVSPLITKVRRTFFGFSDTYVETGTGSGFMWDNDGHIVTNFHVIQDATSCRVTLPDNSTYEADLTGAWEDKDIAVLHIDAPKDKLVPLNVGRSSDLRVGQSVFAIGNPYGLDFTLTTGIVSALGRQIQAVNGRTIQGVIQTDAAINPGNSGGPLLDSAGRLIGMNTAIYSPSGSSAGIGFAVPVDTINHIVPQLISHGKVMRPGLGAEYASDTIARRLGINGVLIITVSHNGPADRAGLQPTREARRGRILLGDVIVKIDDTPTPTRDALWTALEKHKVGDKVKVTVNRGGELLTADVTLQASD